MIWKEIKKTLIIFRTKKPRLTKKILLKFIVFILSFISLKLKLNYKKKFWFKVGIEKIS